MTSWYKMFLLLLLCPKNIVFYHTKLLVTIIHSTLYSSYSILNSVQYSKVYTVQCKIGARVTSLGGTIVIFFPI